MHDPDKNSRRQFVKQVAKGGILAGSSLSLNPWSILKKESQDQIDSNDKIQVAAIGLGIMGFSNCRTISQIDGIKVIAGCDLYKGRLKRAKELYGNSLVTTEHYEEILERDDVDAVLISTSDHWHDKISIAAMKAGKAVYCEKPMVHRLDEGHEVIKTQQSTGKVFQVGSQRVSSQVYLKAKELFESGTIGELNLAEIWYDRQSALGAWQYSIPPDASEDTVNWEKFLGDAPRVRFDATRFFRWRNYQDYGTGVAGDLFVHLFSGLHLITSSNGPERIYATGGLRYWKDGRDVPDVIIGSYDYPATDRHPAFNVQMRVNFIDGGGGGSMIRLVGSEGVMTIGSRDVHVKHRIMPEAPGYGGWDSFNTFEKATQNVFEANYKKNYRKEESSPKKKEDIQFSTPSGYNAHRAHMQNFVDSIRNGKPVIEDATFGLRAAGPALASNLSYFEKKIVHWDPINMKVL
ncbi:Gfo/Idh/MocA family oxidoreductase [Fulvivirgaceae bacterium BMA12]|uniref:Gfo/Idh/MocA family oxidoreductase n=1 Tax=Agaribacillus aureus TaxID=3051825 RepID=A0ABT8KYR1_9BACT|nr:Gfo/Idh/MocA family oxidoreductase [Fulvivirgaceae bacterium BMA12]